MYRLASARIEDITFSLLINFLEHFTVNGIICPRNNINLCGDGTHESCRFCED